MSLIRPNMLIRARCKLERPKRANGKLRRTRRKHEFSTWIGSDCIQRIPCISSQRLNSGVYIIIAISICLVIFS